MGGFHVTAMFVLKPKINFKVVFKYLRKNNLVVLQFNLRMSINPSEHVWYKRLRCGVRRTSNALHYASEQNAGVAVSNPAGASSSHFFS